jgi:hypothetical protein
MEDACRNGVIDEQIENHPGRVVQIKTTVMEIFEEDGTGLGPRIEVRADLLYEAE